MDLIDTSLCSDSSGITLDFLTPLLAYLLADLCMLTSLSVLSCDGEDSLLSAETNLFGLPLVLDTPPLSSLCGLIAFARSALLVRDLFDS